MNRIGSGQVSVKPDRHSPPRRRDFDIWEQVFHGWITLMAATWTPGRVIKQTEILLRFPFGSTGSQLSVRVHVRTKVVLFFSEVLKWMRILYHNHWPLPVLATHPCPWFWYWCRKETDSSDPENSTSPSSWLLISWRVYTTGRQDYWRILNQQVNPRQNAGDSSATGAPPRVR